MSNPYKYTRYYLHRKLKNAVRVNARQRQICLTEAQEQNLTPRQQQYIKALINRNYKIQYAID